VIDYNAGPIPELEEVAVKLNAPIKPGPPDLIKGFIPRQGQLIIAGETNVGKTLITLEIIHAVTTGKPLWGELEATEKIQKVLYVLGEHHIEAVQRHLKITGLKMPDEIYIIGPEQLMYDKYLISKGQHNVMSINKFMKWTKGCDLIVFDPLSAFVTGVDVENDNVQMRAVLETMGLISQASGASCLVLAHLGKPVMNQYGQETKRKSYAIRGASAIEDAATNIFYMERVSNPAIEQATGGEVFELLCRKYKGEGTPKFTLLRDKDTHTHILTLDKPFEAVRKIDLRAKFARFADDNPKFDESTIFKMIATSEGKPVDTIKRWMGLLID